MNLYQKRLGKAVLAIKSHFIHCTLQTRQNTSVIIVAMLYGWLTRLVDPMIVIVDLLTSYLLHFITCTVVMRQSCEQRLITKKCIAMNELSIFKHKPPSNFRTMVISFIQS